MVLRQGVDSIPCASEAQAVPHTLDGIYREHAAEISRWLKRLTGSEDRERIQDLLHEVFLVVQRRLPEFRGEAALRTWLYAIATRVVVAHRRKARLRRLLWRSAEPELAQERSTPETPLHVLERQRATALLYGLLERLSERDRTLIILFELEQTPAEQIAQILGMRPANLWVSLHRARRRLKDLMVEHHPELVSGEGHENTK